MFDWNNYLTLAEYLQSVNTEASKRSSISRSYYYVFHKVRIFCVNNGIITTSESTGRNCHQIIIDKLIEADDIELLEIANRIQGLKERRVNADYKSEYQPKLTDPHVQDTIDKSKEVVSLIVNFVF